MVVVDCGFNIWRKVLRKQVQQLGEASYTAPPRWSQWLMAIPSGPLLTAASTHSFEKSCAFTGLMRLSSAQRKVLRQDNT